MIPSTVRIFVCTEPQDMRRSFDGLALATRPSLLEADSPAAGHSAAPGRQRLSHRYAR